MYRGQSQKQVIISSQNNECNCFGYSQQTRQYFLSKHKSLQLKNKQFQQPFIQQDPILFKNTSKRSLKKSYSPNRQAPLTTRTNDQFQQYYTSSYKEIPQNKRQSKQMHSPQRRYNLHTDRSDYIENERSKDAALLENNIKKIGSWEHVTPKYFYTPQTATISPTRYIITHNNPPPPLRINFSHSPTHKYSPENSPRQMRQPQQYTEAKTINPLSQFKEQVRINIKQANKESRLEEIVQFQLTEANVDSPRNMPIENKKNYQYLQSEQDSHKITKKIPNSSEYLNYGDPFKSKIDKGNNKKETLHSRIVVNKSHIDPKKSGFGDIGKSKVKSLREQKKSLKKIDDVESIRSMLDSQQMEQDKESIVIGKLHEYGSALDPSLSLTTPTLRSKLVSMNSQSSTIAKSYLKPFQFNIDRNHFK